MTDLSTLVKEWAASYDARFDNNLAFPRVEPEYTNIVMRLHKATEALYRAAKELP